MTAPPARNTLSGTPTNAQFNAGIGALYDYAVGLLGAAGTPAAARAALDAVGLTGNETIAGVKTFTSQIVASGGVQGNAATATTAATANAVSNGAVGTAGVADDAITFAKMQNIPTGTILGRSTAGTGDVEALTTIPSGVTVPASAIAGALNASGSAPIYACRAWVNFNGIGTVAIRASGNVSSITDNGVGNYTVNFTTAMPDANYAVNVTPSIETAGANASIFGNVRQRSTTLAGSVLINTATQSTQEDPTIVNVAIFR